jgi:hypothetical protein
MILTLAVIGIVALCATIYAVCVFGSFLNDVLKYWRDK